MLKLLAKTVGILHPVQKRTFLDMTINNNFISPKDGILIPKELYKKLLPNIKIKDENIRELQDSEHDFLKNHGITSDIPISELRNKVIHNKSIFVDRIRMYNNLINTKDIENDLPKLVDLYDDILSKSLYTSLIKVINTSFNVFISDNTSENTDWNLYALNKDKMSENSWFIVVFKASARRINNEKRLLAFKYGTDKIHIEFIGMHIRERKLIL
jgi:hypothetical protein